MSSILYTPEKRREDLRLATERPIEWPSAWGDIPTILHDIIDRFGIESKKAIEFGVEWGYSTSALANCFDEVVGVDTFKGDIHSGIKEDTYDMTAAYLSDFPNISLVQASYQDYCSEKRSEERSERYGMAHVDIVHTYEDTYACGEWCVRHSDVVIFHDTMSFPDVYRACEDLASKYGLFFYNYEPSFGLGILSKKKI